MRHVVSRSILGLLILSALAILAFGPRPESKQVADDRVRIQYWEKWTGDEAAQMQEIVNDFNATVGKEKGIYVEYMSISNVTQKTLIATAAGVPPDIAGLWDGQLVQFAALDALEPLEDLAAEYGIGEGYYKPVYWNACNWNGHLWGLISTPAATCLLYNRQIFEQNADALRAAGLDPTRAPRTIDELNAYARVFVTRDAAGRIDRSGYLPLEPGWYLSYTCFKFGGRIFDPQTGHFTLTDPAVVQGYEWIESYSRELGKDSVSEFRSGFGQFSSAQNPFFIGKVVMEEQGPWMANYVRSYAPQLTNLLVPREKEKELPDPRMNYAWAAAPFPTAVPGLENVTYAGFDALVIPKGAKHKREAFEFIAYINRQDVMEKLNKLHCKNSPLEKVSEDFLNNHPNPYIKVYEDLSRSPNAHGVPQIPIWPEVAAEMDVMTQKIYLLEGDKENPPKRPADYLAELEAKLETKYAEYLANQKARGVDLSVQAMKVEKESTRN